MSEFSSVLLIAGPFVLLASLAEALVLTLRARAPRAQQGDLFAVGDRSRSDELPPGTVRAISRSRTPTSITPPDIEAYDWRAMGVSLLDQVGRGLMRLIPITLAAPAFAVAEEHRLFNLELNSALSLLVLFFGQEFFYYWFHRTAHRVRFFWANHSIHHSPTQLNLSAAYRLGWFGQFAGAAIFFTPLVWLGFDKTVVQTVVGINLLYQFWIHATWIPKLGLLEYVLNTPSAHRVHHASNVRYLDANYGGVLIIFDRLFGSYIEEREEEPCVYGWVKPIHSYNPLRIELTPWITLFQDMFGARTVGEALEFLVHAPGWRPDGPGETTEELRARAGMGSAGEQGLSSAHPVASYPIAKTSIF